MSQSALPLGLLLAGWSGPYVPAVYAPPPPKAKPPRARDPNCLRSRMRVLVHANPGISGKEAGDMLGIPVKKAQKALQGLFEWEHVRIEDSSAHEGHRYFLTGKGGAFL